VGGLIFSQVVTLYLTPVFYTYMDEFNKFMGKHGFKGLVAHIHNHPRWAWAGGLVEKGLGRVHGFFSRWPWYVRLTARIQARHERCCARIERARDFMRRAWGLIRTGTFESKVDLRQGLRDIALRKGTDEEKK